MSVDRILITEEGWAWACSESGGRMGETTVRLEAGINVFDIGCGSAHAINLMARALPKSRFVGFDISEEGIAPGAWRSWSGS